MSASHGQYMVEFSCTYPHAHGYSARLTSRVTFTRPTGSDVYPDDLHDHAEAVVRSALSNRGINPETADITIDGASIQRMS